MVTTTLHWDPRLLTDDVKVYFFMLSSAPKGPQATQPDISQNVADILRLHEDILLQIKTLMPDAHMQSDAAAHQRSNHPRWYSVESAEVPSGESPVRKARPSIDFPWFGSHKDRTLVTMPGEAAEIARVFERMVREAHHPKIAEKIKADRLREPARTLLLIRGVRRQVRIHATEHGDAFEDHTKLVHV